MVAWKVVTAAILLITLLFMVSTPYFRHRGGIKSGAETDKHASWNLPDSLLYDESAPMVEDEEVYDARYTSRSGRSEALCFCG